MVAAGIVDPAKVTRSALQNATSVASTLLTTESVVSTIKEDGTSSYAGRWGTNGNDVINNTDHIIKFKTEGFRYEALC